MAVTLCPPLHPPRRGSTSRPTPRAAAQRPEPFPPAFSSQISTCWGWGSCQHGPTVPGFGSELAARAGAAPGLHPGIWAARYPRGELTQLGCDSGRGRKVWRQRRWLYLTNWKSWKMQGGFMETKPASDLKQQQKTPAESGSGAVALSLALIKIIWDFNKRGRVCGAGRDGGEMKGNAGDGCCGTRLLWVLLGAQLITKSSAPKLPKPWPSKAWGSPARLCTRGALSEVPDLHVLIAGCS